MLLKVVRSLEREPKPLVLLCFLVSSWDYSLLHVCEFQIWYTLRSKPWLMTYMWIYIAWKKKKRRGKTQQLEQTGQSSSDTLNYNDWDLRLCQDFTYTWYQNDSNHRVVVSLRDSIYRLQI
ncbi:unnamed protein product [Vicia faba]|uniref:Uncharacterized protein n=1 Tax=Vicia faba TaxID=3906 RepID=A0AAV0ZFI0_VICFA|nr:unnamed protein product [Vicia faba]